MAGTSPAMTVTTRPRPPLSLVTTGHSRSKNDVAELVIGPATSGRTRWLAYDPVVHAGVRLSMDCRIKSGNDE